MGTIRALLVGVCEYLTVKCPSLPLFKNDLFAMRAALIQGLNVNADNILLCGETGIVTKSEREHQRTDANQPHKIETMLILELFLRGVRSGYDRWETVKQKLKLIQNQNTAAQ